MVAMNDLRVYIVGAAGQLGRALAATRPAAVQAVPLTSAEIDVTDPLSVASALAGVRAGDVVINAAAYTDVDAAETEVAAATAVNTAGPGNLARITAAAGARLVHVSTDYVFTPEPGRDRPFEPGEVAADAQPATVYGATKLAGERLASAVDPDAVIVRTAWVFTGSPGAGDFVATMRRLEAERETISVVDDQLGSPTYAPDLAAGLWELAGLAPAHYPAGAVLHATGGGQGTWFDLARAVFAGLGADPQRVQPCTTADFPRPAPRPAYSVLSGASWAAAGLTPLRDWHEAVAAALADAGVG